MRDVLYVLFDTNGRINRRSYWLKGLLVIVLMWVLFLAFIFVVGVLLGLLGLALSIPLFTDDSSLETILNVITLVLGLPFGLVYLYTVFSVVIKRLHDINRTGWWSLLMFVPIFNWIFLLVIGVVPGTAGPNRFDRVTDG